MHIHILGICGTFMGGIAALARAAHARGDSVTAEGALPVYVRNKVARKRGE